MTASSTPPCAAPPAAPPRCIACDRPPRRTLRLAGGHTLLRCPACGLGWWNWPPLDAAAFYDRAYFQSPRVARGYDDYAALEPGLRRTARGRLRRIAQLLGRRPAAAPPRLLDIGCGTGAFLEEARRGGWQVAGREVSPYAAEQARRRGLDVACGPIEGQGLPPATYDCITFWDVLEHLRDPAGVLRAAGRALRPGGVLALSTGDVTSLCARLCGRRWHLFTLPEHLFFFSPRSLRLLLNAAGCALRHVLREVNWVPVGYLAERLAKSGLPMAGGLRAALRSGPLRRWGARAVPATLADVLGVYAVRRPEP